MGQRALPGGPRVPKQMREVLETIARRLGQAPSLAAELTRLRAEVSDLLHRSLDRLKEVEVRVGGEVAAARNGEGKPAFANEAARNAEIARRLAGDPQYQAARQEADRLRKELAALDARLEEVGRRHRSDANMAYLLASLLTTGLREEAEAALAAYAAGCAAPAEIPPLEEAAIPWDAASAAGIPPAQAEEPPARQEPAPAKGEGDLAEGTFRVLEARPGRGPDTVRAWCEGPDGKAVVYAKNDVGRALMAAVGKRVTIRYRRLDKGLFATKVVA